MVDCNCDSCQNYKPLSNDLIVTFVLDCSGSMQSVRLKTIEMVNEYIKAQKAEDGKTLFNFLLFNSNVETVRNAQDIDTFEPLTVANYIPSGWTALYDAIGQGIVNTDSLITKLSKKECSVPKVLFVIVTDGMENASKKHNLTSIRDLITDREGKGWSFAYLGANQDAWLVGSQFGITAGHSFNFDANPIGIRSMTQALVSASSCYRSDSEYKLDDKI